MEQRNNEVCSICLEPLYLQGTGGSLLSTPCNHIFHRHCLTPWFEIGDPGNCCPLCKRGMLPTQSTPVTLEQANSVARRSPRTATMISTRASCAAASSRPRPTTSRAPASGPVPGPSAAPAATVGVPPNRQTLFASTQNFQRDLQHILNDQGAFPAFQREVQRVIQSMQAAWQVTGVPLDTIRQIFNGIRQQFNEFQDLFRSVERQHSEMEQVFERLAQDHRNVLRGFQDQALDIDIVRRTIRFQQHFMALGEMQELLDSFIVFHNRFIEIQQEHLQVLGRFKGICAEYIALSS